MRITVSEHFFSIQGEGPTAGFPSLFIRMTGCHIGCKFCDTTEVWKKGISYEPTAFLDLLGRTYENYLRSSNSRIIITGGSPLLQQEALVVFMWHFSQRYSASVEIETEGTIMPSWDLLKYVSHCNVSPKLSNSGVPEEKRIKMDVLHEHACMGDPFKFVVKSLDDIKEALSLCKKLEPALSLANVYAMPLCSTREEHLKLAPIIVEWCKANGINFSPRLQLLIWDKATGV